MTSDKIAINIKEKPYELSSLKMKKIAKKRFSFIEKSKIHFIELYNVDCLVGMDFFPDKYFDIIVTSPPYNLGITYDLYDDSIPRKNYLAWLLKITIKIKQKMKDNGSFFLNLGASPKDPWGPLQVALMLRDYFSLQNVIHWVKSIYIENESYGHKDSINVGHYKPINSKRFLNDGHEYIFHFTKKGDVLLDRLSIGVPYKDASNSHRWKNGINGTRCRGNCWYIPYETICSRDKERPHPATFPIEIVKKCIQLHGYNYKTIVLDPFMGIGSTSLACYKIGVNCVGFEIDKRYYKENIRLIKSETAHIKILKKRH